jgi:uncharacterized protein (TIGR00730 family)
MQGMDPEHMKKAEELGGWMAANGHRLIYGAGNAGMMGAVSDGVLKAGGEAVGVTPDFFVYHEATRGDLTECIVTADMSERRNKMIELGDAFIALPGGTGTLDEISEIMSLLRIGKLGDRIKPAMLYNMNGYYDEIFKWLDKAAANGYLGQDDRDRILDVRSTDDIGRALLTAGQPDPARQRFRIR